MAANKDAMEAVLKREDIDYRELENPSGWMLEVISPVSGDEMERILRTLDTQSNLHAVIIPNVGLSILTDGFEEEYSEIAMAEIVGEEDEEVEDENEANEEVTS